jgi:Trk K+ transport system NAD-binding subunit
VDEDLEIREVKLKNAQLVGVRLSELLLPQGTAIMTVRRGDTFLVPDRNTVLAANDAITVAGSLSEVERVIRVLQHSRRG